MLPNLFYKHNPFTVCSLFFYRFPQDFSSLGSGAKQQIQNAQVWLKVYAKELGVGNGLVEISLRKRPSRLYLSSYVLHIWRNFLFWEYGDLDRQP